MKSAPVLTRALFYGSIVTASIAVVGSIVGYLVAGVPGLVSALIGAGLTALFMGTTALSIVIAERTTAGKPSTSLYFSIVLGMWLLKFALFIGILLVLRGQPFLEPVVMFFSLVAAVIGGLVVDVLAIARARVTYT